MAYTHEENERKWSTEEDRFQETGGNLKDSN